MDIEATQAIPLNDYEEEETKGADQPVAFLCVVGGENQRFHVYEGENIIGRSEHCNICIPVKSLSKEHAAIEVKGDQHFIVDKGSRNKTKRGKLYLTAEARYELRDEDFITFADVLCSYKRTDQKLDGVSTQQQSYIYEEDDSSSDILQPTQAIIPSKHLSEMATVAYAEDTDEDDIQEKVTSPFVSCKQPFIAETPMNQKNVVPESPSEQTYLCASDEENTTSIEKFPKRIDIDNMPTQTFPLNSPVKSKVQLGSQATVAFEDIDDDNEYSDEKSKNINQEIESDTSIDVLNDIATQMVTESIDKTQAINTDDIATQMITESIDKTQAVNTDDIATQMVSESFDKTEAVNTDDIETQMVTESIDKTEAVNTDDIATQMITESIDKSSANNPIDNGATRIFSDYNEKTQAKTQIITDTETQIVNTNDLKSPILKRNANKNQVLPESNFETQVLNLVNVETQSVKNASDKSQVLHLDDVETQIFEEKVSNARVLHADDVETQIFEENVDKNKFNTNDTVTQKNSKSFTTCTNDVQRNNCNTAKNEESTQILPNSVVTSTQILDISSDECKLNTQIVDLYQTEHNSASSKPLSDTQVFKSPTSLDATQLFESGTQIIDVSSSTPASINQSREKINDQPTQVFRQQASFSDSQVTDGFAKPPSKNADDSETDGEEDLQQRGLGDLQPTQPYDMACQFDEPTQPYDMEIDSNAPTQPYGMGRYNSDEESDSELAPLTILNNTQEFSKVITSSQVSDDDMAVDQMPQLQYHLKSHTVTDANKQNESENPIIEENTENKKDLRKESLVGRQKYLNNSDSHQLEPHEINPNEEDTQKKKEIPSNGGSNDQSNNLKGPTIERDFARKCSKDEEDQFRKGRNLIEGQNKDLKEKIESERNQKEEYKPEERKTIEKIENAAQQNMPTEEHIDQQIQREENYHDKTCISEGGKQRTDMKENDALSPKGKRCKASKTDQNGEKGEKHKSKRGGGPRGCENEEQQNADKLIQNEHRMQNENKSKRGRQKTGGENEEEKLEQDVGQQIQDEDRIENENKSRRGRRTRGVENEGQPKQDVGQQIQDEDRIENENKTRRGRRTRGVENEEEKLEQDVGQQIQDEYRLENVNKSRGGRSTRVVEKEDRQPEQDTGPQVEDEDKILFENKSKRGRLRRGGENEEQQVQEVIQQTQDEDKVLNENKSRRGRRRTRSGENEEEKLEQDVGQQFQDKEIIENETKSKRGTRTGDLETVGQIDQKENNCAKTVLKQGRRTRGRDTKQNAGHQFFDTNMEENETFCKRGRKTRETEECQELEREQKSEETSEKTPSKRGKRKQGRLKEEHCLEKIVNKDRKQRSEDRTKSFEEETGESQTSIRNEQKGQNKSNDETQEKDDYQETSSSKRFIDQNTSKEGQIENEDKTTEDVRKLGRKRIRKQEDETQRDLDETIEEGKSERKNRGNKEHEEIVDVIAQESSSKRRKKTFVTLRNDDELEDQARKGKRKGSRRQINQESNVSPNDSQYKMRKAPTKSKQPSYEINASKRKQNEQINEECEAKRRRRTINDLQSSNEKSSMKQKGDEASPKRKNQTFDSTPKKSRKCVLSMEPSQSDTADSPRLRRRSHIQKPKIMFTGVVDNKGEQIVKILGGEIASNIHECSHLVTDKVRRTVKFLCGVAQGIPIVTPNWLEKCQQENMFVDAMPFLVKDIESEKKFGFKLSDSLKTAEENGGLLKGWKIFVANQVKPEPSQMKDIIKSAGGQYLSSFPPKSTDQTVIIASCDDNIDQERVPVVSAEFILTGILRQQVDADLHSLEQAGKPSRSKGRKK